MGSSARQRATISPSVVTALHTVGHPARLCEDTCTAGRLSRIKVELFGCGSLDIFVSGCYTDVWGIGQSCPCHIPEGVRRIFLAAELLSLRTLQMELAIRTCRKSSRPSEVELSNECTVHWPRKTGRC